MEYDQKLCLCAMTLPNGHKRPFVFHIQLVIMFETTLGASQAAIPGLALNKNISDYAVIDRNLVLEFLYSFYRYIFKYNHKIPDCPPVNVFIYIQYTRVLTRDWVFLIDFNFKTLTSVE